MPMAPGRASNEILDVALPRRRAGLQLGSGLFKPDESTTSSSFTEGTLSGDLLRYKLVRSSSYVELFVNGDETKGVTAGWVISLQRNA